MQANILEITKEEKANKHLKKNFKGCDFISIGPIKQRIGWLDIMFNLPRDYLWYLGSPIPIKKPHNLHEGDWIDIEIKGESTFIRKITELKNSNLLEAAHEVTD